MQDFVSIECWGDEVLKISTSIFRIAAFKSLPEPVDGQLQTTLSWLNWLLHLIEGACIHG